MTVRLEGLRSQPLSSYLCALAVLRLVAEQHRAEVAGSWRAGAFELDGIDSDELVSFFLERYAPTPIFSPWNQEGDPAQNKSTRTYLSTIRSSGDPRFAHYRATLDAFDTLRATASWPGPKVKKEKERFLLAWRAVMPDVALPWLDCAFALIPNDTDLKARVNPLVGTGGNDGRLELSRLFLGELIRLFITKQSRKNAKGWLAALLFGVPGPPLVDITLGQYDINASGGVNGGSLGAGQAASNPWAFVLTLEGALAFGAGTASRLGFGRRHSMSLPFMVRSSQVDADDVPTEEHRGELFAPLWTRPTRWDELQVQFRDGRLEWRSRSATSSLDAVRAVSSHGVARGIEQFERFAFVKRNGLSYVATPRGRLATKDSAARPLLEPIDEWQSSIREAVVSESIGVARRRLDRAQVAVLASDGRASAMIDLLVALSECERAIARSSRAREVVKPVPRSSFPASMWQPYLTDANVNRDPHLSLAAGLASLRDSSRPARDANGVGSRSAAERSAALALRGISLDAQRNEVWADQAEPIDLVAREVAASRTPFATLLLRRLANATQVAPAEADSLPTTAAFKHGREVSLVEIAMLLRGEIDLTRVTTLARALAILDWSRDSWEDRAASTNAPVPPWYALVRACFDSDQLTISRDAENVKRWVLAPRSWGRLLIAESYEEIGRDAAARLRRVGATSLSGARLADRVRALPERCAAALLCHVNMRRLLRQIADPSS